MHTSAVQTSNNVSVSLTSPCVCAVVVVGCAVHFFPSFSFPFSVLQIPNRKDERTNEQTKDRKKSQDDVRA